MQATFVRRATIAVILAGIVLAGQLAAQGDPATLSGRITAVDGAVIVGVQVIATSWETGS